MRDFKTFTKLLPKAEFNANWTGCIGKQMLKKFDQDRFNPNSHFGPPLNNEQREIFWTYGRPTNMNIVNKLFSLINETTFTGNDVVDITVDIIKRFTEDNVFYLELRFTPRHNRLLSKEQSVRAVIAGIILSAAKYRDITVRLLLNIDRQQTVEEAKETVNIAIKFQNMVANNCQVIRGISVSGDPKYDARKFLPLLQKARKNSLIVVLDLAETLEQTEELYELLQFRPDRICHLAVLHEIEQDSTYRKICVDRLLSQKIPVEICCTSYELKLRCSQNIRPGHKSHFSYLHELEHPMLISACNPELFGSSLSNEYYCLAVELNLKAQQVFELSRMGVLYMGMPLRDERRHRINQRFRKFAVQQHVEDSLARWERLFQFCFFVANQSLYRRIRQRRGRRRFPDKPALPPKMKAEVVKHLSY